MSAARRSIRTLILAASILAFGTPAFAQTTPQASKEPKRPAVIGSPEPRPRTPGAIRLAAYNVENLFDNKDDPSLKGSEEDRDAAKPEAQLRGLASAIRAIDADVIGMAEVESYDALIAFRERYLKGLGYDHVASIDVGADRGIEQSVLSRFPIVDVQVWPTMALEGVEPAKIGDKPNAHAGKPLMCRRSPLRVTVEVPPPPGDDSAKPYRLTLFVVHQKAGRDFDYWREAEAVKFVQLAKAFEAQNPGANIALIGDFNAAPDAKSIQTYIGGGFIDLLAGRSPGDPATMTHASGRTIDYIWFNKALEPEVVRASAFVLSTPQLDPDADWRTAEKPEGYASDHLPVVVDIVPKDQ